MKLIKVKIGDAEVMNQPGVYKNFTGVFDWRGGTFERGILNDSLWRRGTWKNGTWLKNWVYDKNSPAYGEERDTPPGK